MPATVTLSTTRLTYGIDSGAGVIYLASTSGIAPGNLLWIDRELLKVKEIISSTRLKVLRGNGGTAASPHASGATVTFGEPAQFFYNDPVGMPPLVIPVSPWINALNGKVWMSQGDANDTTGVQNQRWWQEVTTTYGTTSLGVRTVESAPTSST